MKPKIIAVLEFALALLVLFASCTTYGNLVLDDADSFHETVKT